VEVYEELRVLARRYMRRERRDHTLQPTALVHEAYLRLADINRIKWQGRTHFLAMAATQMRRILVEHARAARAVKRGAGFRRVTLHDDAALTPDRALDLLTLDEALERLATLSLRQSRIAEARLFAGMEIKDLAEELGVTDRTVKRDWRTARAWLARELRGVHSP
jgi:RNA polymerase sigma factor (TIGR02999 family)